MARLEDLTTEQKEKIMYALALSKKNFNLLSAAEKEAMLRVVVGNIPASENEFSEEERRCLIGAMKRRKELARGASWQEIMVDLCAYDIAYPESEKNQDKAVH